MMFKKTLNFSELKTDAAQVAELKDGEVLQIFHREHGVKVMMTQDHYFALLAQIERLGGTTKIKPHDPAKLMKEIEAKVAQVRDLVGKERI